MLMLSATESLRFKKSENVQGRATVKFNQMSDKAFKMSDKSPNVFVHISVKQNVKCLKCNLHY